ncbi:MAG: methionine--tRNA ligase, partial [Spirochaetaceae bacterium]|nr:methionine--tRNA ligase [Spirochaetaceae bacterium]
VPEAAEDSAFWAEAASREARVREHYEKANLRDAVREALGLSSFGNKAFQDGEPWKTRVSDPQRAATLIRDLVYLIRDLAVLFSPVIPETAARIAGFLGIAEPRWTDLGSRQGIGVIKSEILFRKLEHEQIEALRERFSGSLKERQERERAAEAPAAEPSLEEKFAAAVRLKVAKITKIERHPDAEKLYIETISLGTEERTIVSGLVPHYKEEELLGKNIILVANLKPAKLRRVMSNGMLLAAGADEKVEVLFAPEASPGDDVVLEGFPAAEGGEITIDAFFSLPITAKDGGIFVGNAPLTVGGKALATRFVKDGKVG